MEDTTQEASLEKILELLEHQAGVRWGEDYAEQHRELLSQAADYISNIGNNLPETETEPGFFHNEARI